MCDQYIQTWYGMCTQSVQTEFEYKLGVEGKLVNISGISSDNITPYKESSTDLGTTVERTATQDNDCLLIGTTVVNKCVKFVDNKGDLLDTTIPMIKSPLIKSPRHVESKIGTLVSIDDDNVENNDMLSTTQSAAAVLSSPLVKLSPPTSPKLCKLSAPNSPNDELTYAPLSPNSSIAVSDERLPPGVSLLQPRPCQPGPKRRLTRRSLMAPTRPALKTCTSLDIEHKHVNSTGSVKRLSVQPDKQDDEHKPSKRSCVDEESSAPPGTHFLKMIS